MDNKTQKLTRNLLVIQVVTALIAIFIVVLYGFKLYYMGMSIGTIILFIALFVFAVIVAGAIGISMTAKARKKFKAELNNNSDNEINK